MSELLKPTKYETPATPLRLPLLLLHPLVFLTAWLSARACGNSGQLEGSEIYVRESLDINPFGHPEEVGEAQTYTEERRNNGKVVLTT
jgi:hypothetical protein